MHFILGGRVLIYHASALFVRYAGAKVRLMNEQFIELFDVDLVRIPAKAPKWLTV